jgi:hypothetical protein
MNISSTIAPNISLLAHATQSVWDPIALLSTAAYQEGSPERLLPRPPHATTPNGIFRRYDAVAGFEEDGIAWRVYSNSDAITSIPNNYRIYLNPGRRIYTQTIELLLAVLAHPWCPITSFKCIDYDPRDKLADPDFTKIVLYFDNPVHAASAAWLLRGATADGRFLDSASVLSDTIPITALIQSLGGRREHFRFGDPEVSQRNELLWEALSLRGLI